jgi:thiosulfate dehydrogenase
MPLQNRALEGRHLMMVVTLTTLLAGCDIDRRPPAEAPAAPSGARELPAGNDAFSVEVRRGAAIVAATRDSLPAHVGNALRCTSCHLDGGTREVLGWKGVYARFPQYRSRTASVQILEDRINDCFVRSLAGKRMPADTAPMKAIVSYLAWMSSDVPVTPSVTGPKLTAGFDSLTPDSAAGRKVFETICAKCHGADGNGTTLATPLWGPRSYNIGAGMARYRTAAAFIHANMPNDRPGTLTRQEAIDVAGFIDGRPRPDFAGKEKDWPKGDAPADAPYVTRRSH